MNIQSRTTVAVLSMMLLLAWVGPLAAQNTPPPAGRTKGFTLNEKFEGSSNESGVIMQMTSTLGYNFNKYLGVDAGVPVYFVRPSTNIPGSSSHNSLGNLFVDLRVTLDNHVVNYSTTVTGTAPTGSTATGQSTGRATFDWTNHFEREVGRWTPFVEAGFGNTLLDTHVFNRPFTTLGRVSHFEAGTSFDLWRSLSANASAYAVVPWGDQRVFSRVIRRPTAGSGRGNPRQRTRPFETVSEVVGTADLARDNGFSFGLSASPTPVVTLEVGFARSTHLHLNTVTFGIGFDLTSMLRRMGGQ